MNAKMTQTTIEILGKIYPIRCPESEIRSLQQAAEFLNKKMTEVQDSGKAINLERIAIITAINIAHQFLQADQQKNTFIDKINQRIKQIQEKIESAVQKNLQSEFIYHSE